MIEGDFLIILKSGEDIALSSADAIVNASNGVGYMGGKSGIRKRKRGVAESLHYVSKGEIEKLAREKCQEHSVFGYAPGSIFITPAPNLSAQSIIHAVTMRFPGSMSKLKTIKVLVEKIIQVAESNNYETVAVPMLGTGTGKLDSLKVMKIYEQYFNESKIIFQVYCNVSEIDDRYADYR